MEWVWAQLQKVNISDVQPHPLMRMLEPHPLNACLSPTPQIMENIFSSLVVEVAPGCFDLGCWTVCNGTGWPLPIPPPPIHPMPAIYLTLLCACLGALFLIALHIYAIWFPADKIAAPPEDSDTERSPPPPPPGEQNLKEWRVFENLKHCMIV